MKKILLFCFLICSGVLSSQTAPDWRFGFEYFELDSAAGTGVTAANHDTILNRLAAITAPQQSRGGINIDGINWMGMQFFSFSPINFSETDRWVKRLQQHGFELVFYLCPTATWSQSGNANCNGTFPYSECAPDAAHWADWENYVRACVDRYNGDGDSLDMPGLQIPVRFFVLPQEICFAGDPGGDSLESTSKGFWHDNITDLVELHQHTYAAMRQADPSGYCKLVASGAWFIDLYGDFPDYPNPTTCNLNGPTIQNRLLSANLSGHHYNEWYDSTKILLQQLNDTTGGRKCDYIGWHPHSGWKSSDQSMKFIKAYAPDLPIFIDDMWSAMLPTFNGQFNHYDGYTQFIGGDSLERDYPNATVSNYFSLQQNLDNNVPAYVDWYNAKTAREAVKCFATVFGEGAERIGYSISNDVDTASPLYSTSYPYRFTGLLHRRSRGYQQKPAAYTMQIMVDKLHDFTNVTRLNVSNNNYTRVYQFDRARGTRCYVAWSEAVPTTVSFPTTPNGETVSWTVLSPTLTQTNIISQPNVTTPTTSTLTASGNTLTLQLGHEPVFIEETVMTNIVEQPIDPELHVFPNPASDGVTIRFRTTSPGKTTLLIVDALGRTVKTVSREGTAGQQEIRIDGSDLPGGIYQCVLMAGGQCSAEKVVWVR